MKLREQYLKDLRKGLEKAKYKDVDAIIEKYQKRFDLAEEAGFKDEESIEMIDSPSDLKKLSLQQLKDLCSEIRQYMVECCSVNPGHLGSSLGAVELIVGMHYVYDTPTDKIVFDVGHQAYAHKIITGRRDAFRNNRKKDGISGFPKRSESQYDTFGTGHSSTSISRLSRSLLSEQTR